MSGFVTSGAPSAGALDNSPRYASPDGSGTACTQAAPCDIVEAINNASSGADVTVAPGQYGTAIAPIPTALQPASAVTIHGQLNNAAPTIESSADAVLDLHDAFADHLHVIQIGDGKGLILAPGVANHMLVTGGSLACEIDGGSLLNSVCSTTYDVAVETFSVHTDAVAVLRNVTAAGTGIGTKGVECRALFSGANCSVQMINSIVDGGPSGPGYYSSVASGASVTFTAFNSAIEPGSGDGAGSTSTNFDSSNIFASAKYVNADELDFHQAADSPTIDAGLNSGAQKSGDPDGLPRVLGSAVDIGAYEFAPKPAIGEVTVTKRGRHALHLTASVLSQKLPTLVRPTARHGHTTVKGRHKVLAGSGSAKVVKLVVKHLTRHTKYTIKVVGIGLGGSASGTASGRTR